MAIECFSSREEKHNPSPLKRGRLSPKIDQGDEKMPVEWLWFDTKDKTWISAESSAEIEKEYQRELKGNRHEQLVYHCFGDRSTAFIDFEGMKTYCGGEGCPCDMRHHMVFKLKRQLPPVPQF
jgi:hypothetical protein